MKKQTKRILAVLLVTVMCLGILAGCEQTPAETTKPVETTKPTETTVPTETTAAPVLKNVDIYPLQSDKVFKIVTTVAGDNLGDRDCAKLWTEVTGVEVEFHHLNQEQLSVALSTKEIPDAIFYSGGVDRDTLNAFGDEGLLVNYMEYLDIMPNLQKILEQYPTALDAVKSASGAVYTLPRIGTTSSNHSVIYVRTDMLRAAGWEKLPATTDEFLQCLKDVQAHFGANDPEFKAFSAYSKAYMTWSADTAVFQSFFPAFGDLVKQGLTVDANDKIVLGAATDQYKRLLAFLHEMIEAGVFAFGRDIYAEDGTAAKAAILNNKVAISANANYMSGQAEMDLMDPLTSQWQSEKRYGARSSINWRINSISTACEDIETMIKWMDSYLAPESDPLNEEGTIWGLSYWMGELGVDWVRDEEAKTYEILPHEGYDSSALWQSSQSAGGTIGLYDFMYAGENDIKSLGTATKLWQYRADWFDTSILLLNEEEQETYIDYWSELNSFITQWTAEFVTGDKSIEEDWDDYLQELETMNLQDVIDAYQSAYDRYKAG